MAKHKLTNVTRNWSITALVVAVLLGVATREASASVSTVYSGADAAVFDSLNGSYWYPTLGDFASPTGYTSFSYVTGKIAELNSATYVGISNWHLASSWEFDGLLGNGYGSIVDNFVPNSYGAGQTLYGYSPPYICLPIIGCLGGSPGTYYDYSTTSWSGLLSVSTVLYKEIPDPNNYPLCGYYLFPPCATITVPIPAHEVDVISFKQYEAGSPLLDQYSWNYGYAQDNGGNDFPGDPWIWPISGAWVVGTAAGYTSPSVPEPGTLALLGLGLAGLALRRRHS